MGIKFNVFTGNFDYVGSAEASVVDFDSILTGPTECSYVGPTVPQEVLIDDDGNVLTE